MDNFVDTNLATTDAVNDDDDDDDDDGSNHNKNTIHSRGNSKYGLNVKHSAAAAIKATSTTTSLPTGTAYATYAANQFSYSLAASAGLDDLGTGSQGSGSSNSNNSNNSSYFMNDSYQTSGKSWNHSMDDMRTNKNTMNQTNNNNNKRLTLRNLPMNISASSSSTAATATSGAPSTSTASTGAASASSAAAASTSTTGMTGLSSTSMPVFDLDRFKRANQQVTTQNERAAAIDILKRE